MFYQYRSARLSDEDNSRLFGFGAKSRVKKELWKNDEKTIGRVRCLSLCRLSLIVYLANRLLCKYTLLLGSQVVGFVITIYCFFTVQSKTLRR